MENLAFAPPGAVADALRDFGYEYRRKRLIEIATGKGFEFKDQDHYDQLAELVLLYVGELLETEAGLERVTLPFDAKDDEPQVPIYVSPGFSEADKVLLLLQGGGRVRVGVWGCALCINKDLDHGTMIPYINRAHEEGYKVVVLNPNVTSVAGRSIRGCEDAARQLSCVWDQFAAGHSHVDLVAHSNGGRNFLDFLGRRPEIADSLRKVVFTDSYHSPEQVGQLTDAGRAFLERRCVNFVPSDKPLGEPVEEWVSLRFRFRQQDKMCPCVSAQVEDHAGTNHASLEACFAVLR